MPLGSSTSLSHTVERRAPDTPLNISSFSMCCAYYIGQRLAESLAFRKTEIRPSDAAPIFRSDGRRNKELAILRFGFHNLKDQKLILNARCETLLEKPMFREHFMKHRVLVPATGFHEYDPYRNRFTFCSLDGSSLYFAGIHDGSSFVIITTSANSSLHGVHDRMPLILERPQFGPWLMDSSAALSILRSRPSDLKRKSAPVQSSLF